MFTIMLLYFNQEIDGYDYEGCDENTEDTLEREGVGENALQRKRKPCW